MDEQLRGEQELLVRGWGRDNMGDTCVPSRSTATLNVPLVSWSGSETCLGGTVPAQAMSSPSSQSKLLETPLGLARSQPLSMGLGPG